METNLPLDWFNTTDPLKNYSIVFPFERSWNRTSATIWMQRNWMWSVWASAAYMILIFGGRKLMSYKQDAFDLRWALAIWNVSLSAFSAIGFARSSPEFFRVLFGHGFHHSVCVPSYAQDLVCAFWMEAFILSKLFELIDTAFIVLRKRPLIFLHWYHHVTVLVYCWHAMKDHTAAGRWFSWMNYAVHSIMYAYYAAMALRIRPARWISVSITTLQLTQMIVGCFLVYYVYMVKTYTPDTMCHQTWENLYFCFAIYSTYFLLFLHFFYKAYIARSNSRSSDNSRRSKKIADENAVVYANGGEAMHKNGMSRLRNGHNGIIAGKQVHNNNYYENGSIHTDTHINSSSDSGKKNL